MINIEITVVIDRNPKDVFAYISNFENNPLWQGGMVSARFTTTGALGVGSKYVQEARFMGRRVSSTFEVVEFTPGSSVKATSTSGAFPITFTRSVAPAPKSETGAQVTAVVQGDASGFFKLAKPLLSAQVKRSIEKDYKKLKEILESGA